MEGEEKVKQWLKVKSIFKRLFNRDETIRFFSLVFALFIWSFVNDDLNPIEAVEYSVPLMVEGDDVLKANGWMLVNPELFPKTITVLLKGRRQNMQNARMENVSAVINLANVQLGAGKMIPIEVKLDNDRQGQGIWIDNHSPKDIRVLVEESDENNFKIEVIKQGQLKPGYQILKILTTPSSLSIDAERGILASVDSVKVMVDVQDLDKNITRTIPARLFDEFGNELPIPENSWPVSVKVEVAKNVQVIPVVSGRPAKGYAEILRQVLQRTVLVQGPTGVLDAITDVRTEILNIDGMKETLRERVNLIIPEGITVAYDISQVEVIIDIEKVEEKEFTFVPQKLLYLNKPPSLNVEVEETNINFELIGVKSKLIGAKDQDFMASVNLEGLSKGTHQLPLEFSLPEGLMLKSPVEIQLTLMEATVENP